MPDPNDSPRGPITHETFLGSPVIFRKDGYIDFRSFAETFGLSPEAIADALHAFERMIGVDPQWTSAINTGTTASAPVEDRLWMPLKVFNHVGKFLEVHQEFPQWYATTVTNLALDETHHRTTEVAA